MLELKSKALRLPGKELHLGVTPLLSSVDQRMLSENNLSPTPVKSSTTDKHLGRKPHITLKKIDMLAS